MDFDLAHAQEKAFSFKLANDLWSGLPKGSTGNFTCEFLHEDEDPTIVIEFYPQGFAKTNSLDVMEAVYFMSKVGTIEEFAQRIFDDLQTELTKELELA